MIQTSGVDREESTETAELRSDFAFAAWTLVHLCEQAGLSRREMRDVLCHIAHADTDNWFSAITSVTSRGQRDRAPFLVVDRSRSTPE